MTRKYLCLECDKEFKNASSLASHRQIHKGKPEEDSHEDLPEDKEKVPSAEPPGDGQKPKKQTGMPFTAEASETAFLRLTPKVQNIAMTPDIFIGYMCAVAHGYPGDITDYLSIASRYFWLDRKINPYKVMAGFSEEKEEDYGNGEGSAVGKVSGSDPQES